MNSRRSYAKGGLIPLANNMQYVSAPKHEKGGMMLPDGSEVEGGEVMQQTGYPTDPSERVFSEYMHIDKDPAKPSYAEMAAIIAQQKAQFEQELQQTAMKQQAMTVYMEKKSRPERSTIEREIEKLATRQIELQTQIQQLDVATDQLFNMQEAHAQQIGARDAEGNPNQYVDGIQGGYDGIASEVGGNANSGEYGLPTEGDPALLYQQSPHNQRYGGRRCYATGGTADLTHVGNRLYTSNWQADAGDTGRGQIIGNTAAGIGAGVATGALTGAAIGSGLGPIGAVIGGVIGLGAGLISGIGKRRRNRRAEIERQHLEHRQYLENVTNNRLVDEQRLRDFKDTQSSLSDADYYARTGGRLGISRGNKLYRFAGLRNYWMDDDLTEVDGYSMAADGSRIYPINDTTGEIGRRLSGYLADKRLTGLREKYSMAANGSRLLQSPTKGTGSAFYDKTGFTKMQGIGLAGQALSAIGQGIANASAYRDAKKLAPKAPLTIKFKRMNTDIDIQEDINSIRSAYGRAAAAVNAGSSNAQVRRAHLKRLAAAQSEAESKIYQNRNNTRRDIERANVQTENQEQNYNNQLMNQYYKERQAFNQGLLGMRTGIYDKGFRDLNTLAQSAGDVYQDNRMTELMLSDKDKQIQDIIRNRLFYGRRKRA